MRVKLRASLDQIYLHIAGFPEYWSGLLVIKNPPAITGDVKDTGLILGLGRFPGEGIGYPFQYSWASLVAQMVKNLPAMWETWV